jgi:hypothetical protein
VALTESSQTLPFVGRTVDAVRAWLADHSDRSRAQRAAGTAFLIRVASAVLWSAQAWLERQTIANTEWPTPQELANVALEAAEEAAAGRPADQGARRFE